jgi:hypothetical protein
VEAHVGIEARALYRTGPWGQVLMAKLILVVPATRAYCGRGVMLSKEGAALFGPFRALATASARVAREHGNARCDPLLPFGHTPSGEYMVVGSLPPGRVHPRRPRRFGTVGALVLSPAAGQALASLDNGRSVFPIHGGPRDAAGRLIPTRGGVRLSDQDMEGLLRALNAAHLTGDPLSSVELVEVTPADLRTVPALDLRGARYRIRAAESGALERAPGGLWWIPALGLGTASGSARERVDRRAFLRAALLFVGGLSASSCNQAHDECHRCAAEPMVDVDGGLDPSGLDGGLDAGAPGHHCHRMRYECTGTNGAVFYSDVDVSGSTDPGSDYGSGSTDPGGDYGSGGGEG